jgi:hypothetical protein
MYIFTLDDSQNLRMHSLSKRNSSAFLLYRVFVCQVKLRILAMQRFCKIRHDTFRLLFPIIDAYKARLEIQRYELTFPRKSGHMVKFH